MRWNTASLLRFRRKKKKKRLQKKRRVSTVWQLLLKNGSCGKPIWKNKWKRINWIFPNTWPTGWFVQTAPHWRIRHGALDRDTALAIPAMLAVKLKNSGKKVDFKVAWGYGHAGDYDLPDLFAWTDRICKIKDKADAILKEEQLKAKAKAEAKE